MLIGTRWTDTTLTTRFDDVINGNDGANTIRETAGGKDTFFGHGGSDLLGVARLFDMAAGDIYLDGGDGDDTVEYVRIPYYDPNIDPQFYNPVDAVTLIGGQGDDVIRMGGQKSGVIDAGAGDDIVNIGMGGTMATSIDITLGTGRDTLVFERVDFSLGSIDRPDNIVRDFVAGDTGDRANVGNILLGWYIGSNPFANNQMRLVQSGNDTLFQIDPDRDGTFYQWRTILTFQNTQAEDFTAKNFFRREGDGMFVPFRDIEWDPHAPPAPPPASGGTPGSPDHAVLPGAFLPMGADHGLEMLSMMHMTSGGGVLEDLSRNYQMV